jgi:amino acid adenylation domain-containing protein
MTLKSKTEKSKPGNVEDLYQLSPMQQGMLFHCLYTPDSSVYFEQSLFTIKGELNVPAFEDAWKRVVQRHSILRTAFLWEDLEKPVQAVYRQVDFSVTKHDWRALTSEQREKELQSFIQADRDEGFVLDDAPLMRLALLRYAEDEHKFLFSRHHMVLDRWSRALLLKDFFAIYDALSQGREPALPAPIPYGNYIAWLSRQNTKSAEHFWRTTLAGFTEPTSFSVERKANQPVEEGKYYADRRAQLSEAATDNLRDFARRHRLTLNTLVQGAWALLLSRYSGEDDVVFGVTMAGRPATLESVESMVGLFINTLPLKTHIPAHKPVLSWLKELQAQQSDLQQYEYSSLLDIQGWGQVPRGVPLFDSILVFENLPVGSTHQAADNSVEFREERGIGSTTGYPLTVLMSPGRKLSIQIVYDCSRYHGDAIHNLLTHLQTLLENLPSSAETPVSRLPLLNAAELKQILVDWNDTAVTSAPVSIQKRFEAQVERTPDAAAVVIDGQQLNYRELNSRSNQLAHYLRRLGVGADVKVGICIDRSLEMAIGVLATIKAGGAYVPLDPEYPRERLRFMLEDAQCSVLLTNERLLSDLPETETAVFCCDKDWDKVERESEDNPQNEISGENLLYVIYTSGSTGQPKGVAMTERSLANMLLWQVEQVGLAAARTLQFAPLGFDVSFQEIFSTWYSGGTLLLISGEMRRDALSLLRFLAAQKVQRIFLPFVFLQHLAEAVDSGGTLPAYLTEIITAGEQLEITPQIAKLCSRLNNCALHNHYGPSEAHVVTTYSLSQPVDWPTLPPIGRPIANTKIYILDKNLEPVAIGVPGQLCIGGVSLSRGYLNRPDLTAEKFISDPFGQEAGARLYLTGDLARYQPDGNIEFLGRMDDQVKIRGARVELGEIEAMVAAHPSVREAAVVAREDVKGERKLIGYVVPAPNISEDLPRELRGYLRKSLPDYMIPATFVTLEALLLTPSGKIDRRALAALENGDIRGIEQYEAPREPAEEKLAEIWAAVLRLERVGIRDNFFELGGHSLLATQLISRVRNAFRVELPLRKLFESPTVAELASVILEFDNPSKNGAANTIIRDQSGEAEELLTRIDELSDEDVDSLLRQALAENS